MPRATLPRPWSSWPRQRRSSAEAAGIALQSSVGPVRRTPVSQLSSHRSMTSNPRSACRHGRRRRHSPVAAVARRLSRSSSWRCGGNGDAVPAGGRAPAGTGGRRPRRRGAVRGRQRRAPLPGPRAAARARLPAPAALLLEPVGPQHRAGDDAGRAAGAARRRRSGAGGRAGRPHRRPTAPPSAARCCGGPRRGRRRDRASSASRPTAPETGYGYIRADASTARGAARGRALRREARRRHRRALSGRGRLLLEQRHLRAARLGLAGRARALPPRHPRRGPRGAGTARTRRRPVHSPDKRRRSPPCPRNRSTTR